MKLDIGDCWWAAGVEVAERVASPDALRRREQIFMPSPLRLVAGERRGWRLPRGEYRVALLPAEVQIPRFAPLARDDSGQHAAADSAFGLLLSTTAMNCVPLLGNTQDLHCIALAGASADVRNPQPAGGGELSGTFLVERWDLPSRAAGSRAEPTRYRPGGKPLCPADLPTKSEEVPHATP